MNTFHSFKAPSSGVAAVFLALILAMQPSSGLAASAEQIHDRVDQAVELIRAGDGEAAMALLRPLEADGARLLRYNYAYGMAAHATGEYSEAVYAFRRVVAQDPAMAGARMDLARAYYALGDDASAREEFQTLLEMEPPIETQAIIEQYLSAIRQRGSGSSTALSGFVITGAGHDSNANNATDIRDFQGFTLDERSRSMPSGFADLGLGGRISKSLAPRWRLLANGQGLLRKFQDAGFVDRDELTGGVAARFSAGDTAVLLGISANLIGIDGQHNSRGVFFDAGLRRPLPENWRLALDFRHGQARYSREISVRDVDPSLFSIGVSRSLSIARGGLFAASVIAGVDDPVGSTSTYGRDLLGGSLRLAAVVAPRLVLNGTVSWLRSEYDNFTATQRDDEHLQAVVDASWSIDARRRWQLRPAILFARNDSDVALFDYERVSTRVNLRRNFE